MICIVVIQVLNCLMMRVVVVVVVVMLVAVASVMFQLSQPCSFSTFAPYFLSRDVARQWRCENGNVS